MLFLHKLLSLPRDSVSHQIFLRKLYLYLTNSPVIKRRFVTIMLVRATAHIEWLHQRTASSKQRSVEKTSKISGTFKIYVIVAPETVQ